MKQKKLLKVNTIEIGQFDRVQSMSFNSKCGLWIILLFSILGSVKTATAQCVSASFTSTAPACTTTPINFTNTSGNIGGGWTYFWDFDYPNGGGSSPATSTLQNPSNIDYSGGGSGNYTVAFTITNVGSGCSSTILMDIDIRTARADFSTLVNSACVGTNIDFVNTGTLTSSATATVTHSWSFGSGATPSTSTLATPPSVVYSTSGVKTITHSVSVNYGGCGGTRTDVRSKTINIFPNPIVNFTSNAPQCIGALINFTNTGTTGSGYSYLWDFGAGASPVNSSAQNPTSISYKSSGVKTVTLTISDQNCTSNGTKSLIINETPKSNFESTAPTCTGLPVSFINTGTTTGVSWSWSFGNGATPSTSTAQNPSSIIYSNAGSKLIKLITTNILTGCTDTLIKTININQTPSVSFTSTAPVCVNSNVDFTNTGSTGGNWIYNWDFGKDAIPSTSTTEHPKGITYDSAGTKTIALTIIDGICSSVKKDTIVINATPVVDFTSTAPQCTGIAVDFTNKGSSNGVTYAWNLGVGASPAISTLQNPTGVIYSTAGTKTITLTLTNSTSNCSVTKSQTININQTPSVSFTSTAPVCVNSNVDFTNTGSTGGNWIYNWDFGKNAIPSTSTTEHPKGITYDSGNEKIVSLSITDGICTHIDTNTIFINILPLVDAGKDTVICSSRSVQIGSTSLAGFAYSWFPISTLNKSNISSPISSPLATITNYIVTVTNTITGCSNQDSVKVTMLSSLIAKAGIDVEICKNDSIQVGAALIEGQQYKWVPTTGISDESSPNPIAKPATTTTYKLIVTGGGCDAINDEVTVLVHQLPIVNAGLDDTITTGSFIQLIATGGVQYSWSPSDGLNNIGIYNPLASPINTTDFKVNVIDIFGCENSDTVKVVVKAPSFWIPTAFSPDGNGSNDLLYVRGSGITNFEFMIFNRWGEIIFYSNNIENGWDGRKQLTREELPEGAYIYIIKGVQTDGEPINEKGLVNLVR